MRVIAEGDGSDSFYFILFQFQELRFSISAVKITKPKTKKTEFPKL